ncbi:MAG: hypothetical protein M0Q51_07650 [Bacteroidales bacterium]|nr:hypothetical protein [Bacteroidales bacterium]
MEDLNSKSTLLANAMAGSKKKLLFRVKRLLTPVKLRKGLSEGIIAFILLVGLIFTLSLNALSFIPSTFDLTGRESGERIFNLMPVNPETPDTIIATSKSGKVIVKVYTDSTDATDDRDIKVFVETLDKNIGEWENARNDYEKEVIILKKNSEQLDSMRKVVIIKSGNYFKVIKGDTILWIPEGYDTSIVTDGGFQFYGFDVPEFPEIPEMPDLKYDYYNDDQMKWSDKYDRALREYEFKLKDFEKDQQLFPAPAPPMREFSHEYGAPPAEKIIRQELIDDGLAIPRKKYVIDLDSRAMYINGEKQPKEVFRKYKHLVESLEVVVLEGDGTFRLIF